MRADGGGDRECDPQGHRQADGAAADDAGARVGGDAVVSIAYRRASSIEEAVQGPGGGPRAWASPPGGKAAGGGPPGGGGGGPGGPQAPPPGGRAPARARRRFPG